MIDFNCTKSELLEQIKNKYYKCDLSGISYVELIQNEKRHGGKYYTSYPLKDEYDALSATGNFTMYSNHDGGQITFDIGSIGNERNIHDER